LKSYDLHQEREIGEREKKKVEFGYGETNEKKKKKLESNGGSLL